MFITKEIVARIYLVILVFLVTVLLRIPNLFEPVWNIDESIYLTIGRSLQDGKHLYVDVYDNKPPLIYFVAYFAAGNIVIYKSFLLILGLANIFVFYLLSKYFLSQDVIARFVAVAFFSIFISTPVFEGNILNGEILFMLPVLLSFFLFFKFKSSPILIFISGILIGIAGLVKIPALIDGLIIPLYLLAYTKETRLPKIFTYSLGVATPILITLAAFFINGSGVSFIQSVFGNNLDYIKNHVPPDLYGLERLGVRLVLFTLLIIVLFLLSKKIEKRTFFIITWFLTSLLGALLSSRPYTHYMLQVIPSVTLAFTLFILRPGMTRLFTGTILIIFVLVLLKFKFIEQDVMGYYGNFLKYATGDNTREEYLRWFGPEVADNYRLAGEINSRKDLGSTDDMFLLSDHPILYVLTDSTPHTPYFVGFHIVENNAQYFTFGAVKQDPPKLVVVSDTYKDISGISSLLADYVLVVDTGLSKIYLHNESNISQKDPTEKAAHESGLKRDFVL